jgi:hypothetical protein
MYSYEYPVVGGDAYNFMIIAARGTGLICAGVLSAVVGAAFAIYEVANNKRPSAK